MKKILLALALVLIPGFASAQCSGVFPAGYVCGATTQAPPKPIPFTSFGRIGCVQLPALTGDVTTVGGTCATTLATAQPGAHTWASAQTIGASTNTTIISPNLLSFNTTFGAAVSLNTDGNGGLVVNTNSANSSDFWFSGPVGVGTSLRAQSGAIIGWTASSSAIQAPDAAFSRASPGVLSLGTGAGGSTAGTLQLNTVVLNGSSLTGATGSGTVLVSPVANANLATATANTVKGNFTASTTTPSDNAMPSCSDTGGNHLNYVSGTGITCGTTSLGSAVVLLNTLTASNSASLADTTSFTSTYSSYLVVFNGIIAQTATTTCRIRVNVSGIQTTGYLGAATFTTSSATIEDQTTYIPCSKSGTMGNDGSFNPLNATFTFYDPAGASGSASKVRSISGSVSYVGTGPIATTGIVGGFFNTNTNAVTGFQVDMSSGNITSGVIKVYGIL